MIKTGFVSEDAKIEQINSYLEAYIDSYKVLFNTHEASEKKVRDYLHSNVFSNFFDVRRFIDQEHKYVEDKINALDSYLFLEKNRINIFKQQQANAINNYLNSEEAKKSFTFDDVKLFTTKSFVSGDGYGIPLEDELQVDLTQVFEGIREASAVVRLILLETAPELLEKEETTISNIKTARHFKSELIKQKLSGQRRQL